MRPTASRPRRARTATLGQTRALTAHRRALVAQLRGELGVPPSATGRPTLIMLMGYPGVGKSHCAQLLAARLGAAHIATDHLRRRLFIAASYADEENRAVFGIAEALVDELLSDGYVVVLDATNLVARNRAPMEAVAARHGAPMLHVLVVADDADIRDRLQARSLSRAAEDHSDADVAVYERMRREGFEPPQQYVELRSGAAVASEIERLAQRLA